MAEIKETKAYPLIAPKENFEAWSNKAHEQRKSLAQFIRDTLNEKCGIASDGESVAVKIEGVTK